MNTVSFTYSNIIEFVTNYIYNVCDNISSDKYNILPPYVKQDFHITKKLKQTFKNNIDHGAAGDDPTVTWRIKSGYEIPNCSAITKTDIQNNIKTYININNDLAQHPSANGLIVFLNKIVQFCKINLSFYSQVFDTSNTTMASNNELPFRPTMHLIYQNINDYSSISDDIRNESFYNGDDIIYANTINRLYEDLIEIIKNNINIKTIQYTISFNR